MGTKEVALSYIKVGDPWCKRSHRDRTKCNVIGELTLQTKPFSNLSQIVEGRGVPGTPRFIR